MKLARHCPALAREIKPAECGAWRGSKVSCPPECGFWPFGRAAFPAFQRVDESLAPKIVDWLLRDGHRAEIEELVYVPEPAEGEDDEEVAEMDEASQSALQDAMHYYLVRTRDHDGRTGLQRWRADGMRELDNDERQLADALAQSFVTVLEVDRIADAQSLFARDLLADGTPEVFVVDDILAGETEAGFRLLTWVTPLPSFWRIGGPALPIPDEHWEAWLTALRDRFATARAEQPILTLREYLSDRLAEFAALLADLDEEPETQTGVDV